MTIRMIAKKILKIFVILTGTLLAFLLVVIIGIQLFLGTGTAGRLIQDRVNALISGHISWEDQSLSVFRGLLVIENARVQGLEKETIIEADRLSVDIGLTDLLNKELVIQSARMDRPGVFLESDADGQLNLIRAFAAPTRQPEPEPEVETKSQALAFNIRIIELILEQGCFTFGKVIDPSITQAQNLRLENIVIAIADADLGQLSGKLDVTINGGHVDMAGIQSPVNHFSLSTILADGRLDPLNLELGTADSRINLSGAVDQIFDKPSVDLKLTMAAELAEIRQILQEKTELSGPLLLDMTATGSLENPDVTLKLNYTGGRLAGMDVHSFNLKSRMQDRKIVIERLDAATAAGKLESTGRVDMQSAFADGFFSEPVDYSTIAYQFDLNASDARLSAFPEMAKASGTISTHLHLSGRGISLENLIAEADVDVQGNNISVDKTIPPVDLHIAARAGLTQGRLAIDSLTINTPEAGLKVSGAYALTDRHLNLSANAQIPDLETLLAPLGISGVSGKNVKMVAEISGPDVQPTVKAVLYASHLAYQDFMIGDLKGTIGFADGRVNISSLDLQNNESKISLTGSVQVLEGKNRQPVADPGIDLALTADPVFLQDFVSGISGQLKLAGAINGSLGHPAGAITLDGVNLDLGGQIFSAVRLATRIEDRKIFIEPLLISMVPDQNLRAQGWVSLDQAYELDIDSDPISIKAISQLADSEIKGKITLSAKGVGRFSDPQLEGQVFVSGLAAGKKDLPDMKINVALKDQTIRIDTADPFAMNARYDLTEHDFSAAAELSETELAPFFQIAGQQDFNGQITGSLKANGNTKNPDQMQAILRISNLSILQKEKELIRTTDLSVDLENGGITIPGSRITLLKKGYVDIRGTAQGTARGDGFMDGQLNLSADGYIPAALIDAMVEEIDQPQGGIRVAAQIQGPMKYPVVSGNITFESVGLMLTETMQKFHEINGQISLTNQAVNISGLRGRLDTGKFSLEGKIDIENFAPKQANLNLIAQTLPFEVDGMLEMQINSDLKISGTPDNSSLSGSIELLDGQYYKDVNLSLIDTAGEIGKRKRQTVPQSETAGIDLPFLKNLTLDVSLSSRNPFAVDNNIALLSIIPALRIRGDVNNPMVSGRAKVTEGTITYRDTEFEIKKGVVDFVNPYRIEPSVDIQAESRIRQWVITMAVSGTSENLDFKFSSSPPEEDADILSLMLVGKTTREMAAGSGGDPQSPEEMLANLVAGTLAGQVKEETGLDIVELEYKKNGSEARDAGEVKVTVGKELSRRLTVKYGVKNKSGVVVQQSTAIYKLFENLSVNTFQDTEGDFGGEMLYRREFR